jgi:lauroyl/myristoyl acyltransferase
MSNKDYANRIQQALAIAYPGQGTEVAMLNALVDLRHLADAAMVPFMACVHSSHSVYWVEREAAQTGASVNDMARDVLVSMTWRQPIVEMKEVTDE